KALIARQSMACEELLRGGWSAERVLTATVAELPATPVVGRALELRGELGIESSADAPAFVAANGAALQVGQLDRWLRAGRLVRTSLEANGGICRSLLAFRHSLSPEEEVLR
ncbi:MAG TPA: hypothetical protein VND92_02610, partial [Vicinamibacterales bacterium]|nr:hypothetical protein [Vicinamibacterales bacterium]